LIKEDFRWRISGHNIFSPDIRDTISVLYTAMVIYILHREKKSFFSTRNIRKNLSRKILSINNFLFQHNIQGFKDRRENVFKESDWLTYLWIPTGNFSAEI